jgi:hypothetical protein
MQFYAAQIVVFIIREEDISSIDSEVKMLIVAL